MEKENSEESGRFSILMFPWLAHGHIFPFLELAKALLVRRKQHDLHVYLCSTAINFSSIKNFIDKNRLSDSLHLVEIHLQTSHDELPPHYHTTKNLPSHLNFKLLKAIQTANSSFSDIIGTLKPDLVIYDVFQPWASKIAAKQGIPAVYFSIYGGLFLTYRHHQYTYDYDDKTEFPFPGIEFKDHELDKLDLAFEFLYKNIFEVDRDFLFGNFKQSHHIVLVKTCRGIEGKFIDYLSDLSHKKIVPVGPLITYDPMNPEENSDIIIQWLNKKNRNSTIFVSFGSEYFLSEDEIREIAKGLDLSKANFIWIIRFPADHHKSTALEDTLPTKFLNTVVKERGLVVTGWAPQADILAHPNMGGFVTHCGWSSIVESMYFGVPVVAMPMKLDQPINAKMLSDAGSCVEVVRDDANGLFKGEEIAKAIRKVVAEKSTTGDELRRRARELSETMKMEKEQALDEAAQEIWKLCKKN